MQTEDGLEILTGALLYLFLTIGFPAFLLYGLGAAQEQANLVKYFFYGILGLAPLAVNLVTIYLDNRGFFDQNPALKGFKYFTFHSPGNTALGKRFPKLLQAKVLLPISMIVALFFGALVSVSGQVAVGTPQLVEGSVAPSASLGLAVEPAVSSETFFFNVGMLFGLIGLFYMFLYGRGVSARVSYVLSHVISWLLTSVLFLLYHNFRYGASETSQASVLLLGLLTNGFTALTHSIIPGYTLHGSGNFFSKAAQEGIFTSDVAILITVLGVIVSGGVLVHLIFKELG